MFDLRINFSVISVGKRDVCACDPTVFHNVIINDYLTLEICQDHRDNFIVLFDLHCIELVNMVVAHHSVYPV